MSPAVSDFSNIVEPKSSGRNFARAGYAYFLERQIPTIIIEAEHQWAPNGCLQPFTVVIGGVVVTQAGVEAANAEVEIFIVPVYQFQTLKVGFDDVVSKGQDDQFSQGGDMVRKT